jgi:hypothetical protein
MARAAPPAQLAWPAAPTPAISAHDPAADQALSFRVIGKAAPILYSFSARPVRMAQRARGWCRPCPAFQVDAAAFLQPLQTTFPLTSALTSADEYGSWIPENIPRAQFDLGTSVL